MNVVIDVETTGLAAGWHEVIEMCILPVDDKFFPMDVPPFHTQVRPEFPERVEIGAMIANHRVQRDAPDKQVALAAALEAMEKYPTRKETIAAFADWHKTVANSEKLAWLCHNGSFDMPFMDHWFMPSHNNGLGFRAFCHYQGRDTQRAVLYLQDRSVAQTGKTIFHKITLSEVAKHFGIPTPNAHTALGDCLTTAAVYRRLIGTE